MRHIIAFIAPIIALIGCGENLTPAGAGPSAPGEDAALSCLPNLDGTLEAAELPIAIGQEARYLVSPQGTSRPFDRAGSVDDAGRRTWDLSPDYADDRVVSIAVRALGDAWFAPDFPQADYAAPLDVEGRVLGAYHLDERGLWLHGVASSEPDPPDGRTLLPYDAPVLLFRLPLVPGDRWTSIGEISEGELFGLAYRGTDTYEVSVPGAGRVDLPDWSFGQAWQVDQRVTVSAALGASVQRRVVSWLFECFGEVARAESADGAVEPFDEAAQLRRITLR